ncbi:tetratricopeptide repeat protein [Hydrogenophaga sp.]|uniref:tetratricopeptide repeat protein n=1 Tax=Hydrogenophaga sp. TaxID=1904254 RepID=UPI003AF9C24F
MSAIEQALRQIDQQRERQASDGKTSSALPQPSEMGLLTANEPAPTSGRWGWLAAVLAVLVAVVAAVAWSGLSGRGASASASAGAASIAQTAMSISLAQPVSLPAFQPDTSLPAPMPVMNVGAPRELWQVQASQAWESGAWDLASRLWEDGLRRTLPSTLALQIADLQTREQAQQLHQIWTPHWPVVMLAQPSAAGPRWMVLALPQAEDVDAAQRHLSNTLGHAIPWASVVQWVAKAEVGQTLTPSTSTPAYIPTAVSTKTADATVITAAPAAPVIKETRTEKPLPAATAATPAAAATPLTSTITAAAPQAPVEPPQVSRSGGGAAPDDQTRAVLATKAIDVDFSSVEQMLAKADFEKALGATEQLEAYIGPNWRTRYLAGVALSGLGRWNDALAALANARQKNPGHARVVLYLAVAQQETGDHASAIDTLLKATAAHPEVPELWLNQGHSLQAQGRFSEASQAYRRFLDLSAARADLSQQRSWVSQRLQKES